MKEWMTKWLVSKNHHWSMCADDLWKATWSQEIDFPTLFPPTSTRVQDLSCKKTWRHWKAAETRINLPTKHKHFKPSFNPRRSIKGFIFVTCIHHSHEPKSEKKEARWRRTHQCFMDVTECNRMAFMYLSGAVESALECKKVGDNIWAVRHSYLCFCALKRRKPMKLRAFRFKTDKKQYFYTYSKSVKLIIIRYQIYITPRLASYVKY